MLGCGSLEHKMMITCIYFTAVTESLLILKESRSGSVALSIEHS